jgi:hypothetical protein
MQGFRKRYTKAEDRQYDPPARNAVKAFFPPSSGLVVKDHTNQYGIDLCLYGSDGNVIRCIETETKRDPRWNSPKFPFSDMNFLGRKLDHLLARNFDYSENGLWVLWNGDYTQHAVVTLKDVLAVYNDRVKRFGEASALVPWANRIAREQGATEPEYFLKLPLDVVHMNGLQSVLRKYGQ